MPQNKKSVVVLVHGLWMNGTDMSLLNKRIQEAGFTTKIFSYTSIASSPAENAQQLQAFIQDIDCDEIHFVCHSLGGLVVRHLFHSFPNQRPGKVVTLGTPHQPCEAAEKFSKYLPGKMMLGHSLKRGLLGDTPGWNGSHKLGSIAGTLRFGLGMVITGIPRPNDGTVAVEETRLDGMHEHLCINASHFGLLLSKTVAEQTTRFIQQAGFDHSL